MHTSILDKETMNRHSGTRPSAQIVELAVDTRCGPVDEHDRCGITQDVQSDCTVITHQLILHR